MTQPQDTMQRMRQFLRGLAAAALVAGLLACASRLPQLTVEGAEVELSPVMLGVGSVFMKIVNTGNGGDELVSARLNIPGTVTELHEMKDGRMARVKRIIIPSGTSVEMKPGGPHLMVFMLPKDIREGSEITLALVFEKSGEKKIPAKLTTPHLRRSH
ncbi:MAG TPA: copper chaperone PCu(A)C [Thermodesulfovibrionales bacterium]|nr:copper chaperone PCu(A)C [Thermodesulfovibrionales bacterium]